MPDENLNLVKSLYAAFGTGDIPGVLNLLGDNVDWQFFGPADIPFAGPRLGKPAVQLFFQQLSDNFVVQEFQTDQFIVQDPDVVVLGHETMKSKKSGRTYTAQWTHVHTIAGGKISKFREYSDTEAILRAFWPAPSGTASIGFETVQSYLSGLAAKGVINSSPHKAFWKSRLVDGVPTPVTYEDFINGNVPNKNYHGLPIPILWKEAPMLSPLFLILREKEFAGIPQMIPNGPNGTHLTDTGMTITLADGTTVAGAKVLADLETWLKNGFPKLPQPPPTPTPTPAIAATGSQP